MTQEDLSAKSDAELAEYQAGWKPHSTNDELCQLEWRRRDQDYAHKLAEKVSQRERVATLLGAGFGVVATLLAVGLGVWISK